jgi:cytochrome P450
MTSDNAVAGATMTVTDAAAAITDPSAYASGRLQQAFKVLRRESPVHWIDAQGFQPFYALTRHADVNRVDRDGDLFLARPRYKLFRAVNEPPREGARSLVQMDAPEHTEYRALAADRFRPRGLRPLDDDMRALAKAAVDSMAERGSEAYDFVTEVSMLLPLAVICKMLGVPEEDRQPILRMTQLNFGAEDPEYQRLAGDLSGSAVDFGRYYMKVVEDRRASPTGDVSSLLAHATLNGEPLPLPQLIGYFGILATAGHDTTSATIAGGLRALVDHPDQLQRLRADISLVPAAVEEIIRWVSPVNSFMRTAAADTEIRGQKIAAGESVLLLYSSANRDEEVFDSPDRFDIGRSPNRHMAFGQGAHTCLGANLARMELRAFFTELIPRLRHVELAGQPELVKTFFVGGLKHLPVRTEVTR